MIQVGVAGIGFMGMIHYLTYQKLPNVRVAAMCELNERRLTGDWTDIKGNFGPAGEQMDLSDVTTFTQLEAMLQMDELDVIDVTLPPALHADATVAALEAGKHVFCEKPMSLELDQCDRMTQAAQRAERRLLVGHVLPFFPEYAWALESARNGQFGALRGGQFHRVISDPSWLTQFWNADAIGGPLFDLHVHDAHFIRLLFGVPDEVISRGRSRDELPEYWHTQFSFGQSNRIVEATCGAINQQGRPFTHGFEIHFERATLLFDFAVIGEEASYLCPPTILHESGDVERVELGSGDPMDAFEAELSHVVECVDQNRDSDILSAELARGAVDLCHQQRRSIIGS